MIARRFIFILVLIVAANIVAAQPARGRGAYSVGAPYAVPGGSVQPRGSIFVVNTTAEEPNIHSSDLECDPEQGVGLTLREAIQDCWEQDTIATIYVPAGQYDIIDDLDINNFTHVSLIGEDPLTTIINNTRNDVLRDAGHGFTAFLQAGESVSIANFTFHDSDGQLSSSNYNGGGLLVRGDGGTLTLTNLIFDENVGCNGGGVAIEGGPFAVIGSHLTFTSNIATGLESSGDGQDQCGGILGLGGGLIFTSDADGSTLSISDSVFADNTAVSGGAIYLGSVDSAVLTNVEITGNNAVGVYSADGISNDTHGSGGGIGLFASTLFLVHSEVTLNTAGTPDFSGSGGGIAFEAFVSLVSSAIEDNIVTLDGAGPDCVSTGAPIVLNGGSRLGAGDCTVEATDTDVVYNLLENGGFEFVEDSSRAQGGPKVVSWDLKQGTKRTCNKPDKKPVSDSGQCALQLTNGGVAKQTLSADALATIGSGDTIVLFAKGKGTKSSTTTFTATATFSDGMSRLKTKLKMTHAAVGKVQWQDFQVPSQPMPSGSIEKFTVTISSANTGAPTKQYVDAVYVAVCNPCAVTRDAAPPPSVPAAFRGNN